MAARQLREDFTGQFRLQQFGSVPEQNANEKQYDLWEQGADTPTSKTRPSLNTDALEMGSISFLIPFSSYPLNLAYGGWAGDILYNQKGAQDTGCWASLCSGRYPDVGSLGSGFRERQICYLICIYVHIPTNAHAPRVHFMSRGLSTRE